MSNSADLLRRVRTLAPGRCINDAGGFIPAPGMLGSEGTAVTSQLGPAAKF